MVEVAQEIRGGGSSVTAEPALRVQDLRVSYAGAVQALRGVSLSVPDGAVRGGAGQQRRRQEHAAARALGHARRAQRRDHGGHDRVRRARARRATTPPRSRAAGWSRSPRAAGCSATSRWRRTCAPAGWPRRTSGARDAGARAGSTSCSRSCASGASQRAGLLSGGEQQMLAIGRALMASPKVLLLDEPSLGLAPKIVERVGEVIREINARGVTVVLVEQNAAMALAVADRAVVLEVGQVALEGTAAELAESEAVRERYLGVDRGRAPAKPAGARRERRADARGRGPVRALRRPRGAVATCRSRSSRARCTRSSGPTAPASPLPERAQRASTRPAPGRVRYGGDELTRLRPHRIAALGVARTFQNLALSPRRLGARQPAGRRATA